VNGWSYSEMSCSNEILQLRQTIRPTKNTSVFTSHTEYIFFKFMWPFIVTNFFTIKPTRRTNFPNIFWHETLHVSGSSSSHHQEFIHYTFGTGVRHIGLKTTFEQDQDGTHPSWFCSKALFKPVWHIQVPNVQWINSWWWAEKLPETCRASCQNIFGKLVRLVGFIVKKHTESVPRLHCHVYPFYIKPIWLSDACVLLLLLSVPEAVCWYYRLKGE